MKFQDARRLSPSTRIALGDLRLDHFTVLYPGDVRYTLGSRVMVVPLGELAAGNADALTGHRPRGRRR